MSLSANTCSTSPPAAYLEDAVAVLGQRCGGVGGVHLRELLGKVADVQLVPNDRLERSRHLLRSKILPVYFLKLVAIVFLFCFRIFTGLDA